ncbi:MAG: c-type cytochrome domain-containing protein [Roseibacillus sp.]
MPDLRSRFSVVRRGTLLLLAPCSLLPAAEKITYDDHIFPIFESSCLNCHNPDKKKSDLDLSNYTGAMAGGSGGAIAESGDGASSKIYASVTHTAEPFMPPKGDRISKKDADLIRAWIDGGLLENSSSRAKKRSGPRITAIDVDPSAKPEGPPPMPEHLNLEPVVISSRNTVVNDMACSPWAPLLAVTAQKQILLYNTDTLQLAAILPFPKGFPETVSFHPTGKYLMAGGGIPGKSGTTYTWEVSNGKLVMENGKEFDSVLASSLRLDLGGVALGGPSRLIKLWDTQTGEQIKSIKKHTDWVTALSYSPDGVLLATGDRNGGVWVWESLTGNEFHTLRGHGKGITALAWRSDSNLLATASEDGQVIFWEMNNGKQVKKFPAHGGGALSLDYARNGEFVTSGRDRKVKIWKADFNLKKELPTFSEMVVEVAITQDGKRVFTADWNGIIEAWDAITFKKLGELQGNPPPIADRIVAVQNEIKEALKATTAAKVKVDAAQEVVTAAKTFLQEAAAICEATKKRVAQLAAEKVKLEPEFNRLNQEHTKLTAAQNTRRSELEQAQKRVANHKDVIAKADTEVKKFDLGPANAAEKNLVVEAKRMRDESNAKPEDAALKQQAEGAEKQLAEHRDKLVETRSNLAGAQSRLTELRNQLAGIASNVGAAQKDFAQASGALQKLDTERAKVSDRRAKIGPEAQAASKRVPVLEKSVKNAQDKVAAKEKDLAPPKAAFDQAVAHEGKLQADLKFWRAEEVNAKALVVAGKRDTLKTQHDDDLAAFDDLSTQVGQFREELAKVEARKGELARQIEKVAKEVGELRAAIDKRAPELDKIDQETKALQGRYQELLK